MSARPMLEAAENRLARHLSRLFQLQLLCTTLHGRAFPERPIGWPEQSALFGTRSNSLEQIRFSSRAAGEIPFQNSAVINGRYSNFFAYSVPGPSHAGCRPRRERSPGSNTQSVGRSGRSRQQPLWPRLMLTLNLPRRHRTVHIAD